MFLYLHKSAAAFVNWALGWCWCCCVTACSDGCVIAASAAKFWIFIGGKRPAAAAAADSFCALRPGKYISIITKRLGKEKKNRD